MIGGQIAAKDLRDLPTLEDYGSLMKALLSQGSVMTDL
jgi:hypothetical protein